MRRQAERIVSGLLATIFTPPTSVLWMMVGETIFMTTLSPGRTDKASSRWRIPRCRNPYFGVVSAPMFFSSS